MLRRATWVGPWLGVLLAAGVAWADEADDRINLCDDLKEGDACAQSCAFGQKPDKWCGRCIALTGECEGDPVCKGMNEKNCASGPRAERGCRWVPSRRLWCQDFEGAPCPQKCPGGPVAAPPAPGAPATNAAPPSAAAPGKRCGCSSSEELSMLALWALLSALRRR